MNQTKRTILIVALIVGVPAFLIGHATGTKTVYQERKTDTTQSEKTKTTPVEKKLTGNTDTATESFHLNKGTARIEVEFTGTISQISVSLVDKDGEDVAFIMSNEIGAYKGSTSAIIEESGDYSLVVTATGPWAVTIKQ